MLDEQPTQGIEIEVGTKAAKGKQKEPRNPGTARLKRKGQTRQPKRRRGRRTS